jgi:ABC-type antimicrobial peptide transport system permease subunit
MFFWHFHRMENEQRRLNFTRGACPERVAVGLVLGLPLAVGAARFIAAQLYGVSFWDPFALTIAAVSLAVCAFFAAIIPAGRAAAISPMSALRTE